MFSDDADLSKRISKKKNRKTETKQKTVTLFRVSSFLQRNVFGFTDFPSLAIPYVKL